MSRIAKILFATLICLSTVSCDKDSLVSPNFESDEKVEVVLPVSSSALTRTELDPDDLMSVRWSVGDQVALWADGESNDNGNLTGEMFQLKYYNQTFYNADFSGSITPMDDKQEYEYCAFYPYTSSFSGKSVSYTLPAVQEGGLYDGKYDFRVADCVTGPALTAVAVESNLNLTFRPLTHALRITIPEGYNNLGVDVQKLVITMPTEIIGTYSLDVSDATTTPSLTSGGANTVTVDLGDRRITDGDGEYVWVFINPVSNVTGDILITGIGPNEEISHDYAIPIENHTFSAGHITPINTEIGTEFICTTIKISVDTNNLGEELTNIIVTAGNEDAKFADSNENSLTIYGQREFIFRYETIYNEEFKSSPLKVQFESNNTLFYVDDISLSDVEDEGLNEFTRNAPYILSEDFSTIENFKEYYYDNGGIGEDWDSDAAQGLTGVDLSHSDYGNLETEGWTANRVGAEAGTAIRITGRYETALTFITGHYEGRLDSPTFSRLKPDAKVDIKVEFKYKAGRHSSYYGQTGTTGGWIPWPTYGYINGGNGEGLYNYGSTTETGGLSGGDDIQNKINENYLSLPNTEGGDSTASQDYENIDIDGPENFIITNATQGTRASWRVTNSMSNEPAGGANGNFWLYIDDIYIYINSNDN